MTREEAKTEIMQIYGSLSEEKKKALDVAFKAMEQADNIPVMYYPQVDGITPTVVAQADGEYISKEAVIDIIEDVCPIYGNDYRYILREKINELPTVAIPSAEPKIVPIAEIKFDDDMLHEIVEEAVKNIEIEPKWIPVSERLPDECDYRACYEVEDGAVLWTNEDGLVGMGYYYESTKTWSDIEDNPIAVIAWMPLPPSYQGEK